MTKLLTLNKIMTRKAFVEQLLKRGAFKEEDRKVLMNVREEQLALMVQNAWSPEARAAAQQARHRRISQTVKSALAKGKERNQLHTALIDGLKRAGYEVRPVTPKAKTPFGLRPAKKKK